MAIIEVRGLSYRYPQALDLQPPALQEIDLTIEAGQIAVLAGATGSGKTTLCLTLNGMIPHLVGGDLSGEVRIDGTDTSQIAPADLADVVGMVYQDADSQLLSASAAEEVAFGLENLGLDRQEISDRTSWVLDAVGLHDHWHVPPAQLSGGQKARLTIACALARRPRVLILDEALTSLDPAGREALLQLLRDINRQQGTTVLMTVNKLDQELALANRLILIESGRLLAQGEPRELLSDPALWSTFSAPTLVQLAWQLRKQLPALQPADWLDVAQAERDLRGGLHA
ncbi:MAG: ABC transporter ATP-binding protein [Chloroflexi bacterium]|nr:ABC transporter ATP-binding protein [Chloroflexota bacterium]